jgi:hypothetical protein
MTACFGRGVGEKPVAPPVVADQEESQSTSGESSFGEVISVLPGHADPEWVAEQQVLRMTSSMADPAGKKVSNKCNLL